MRKNLNVIAAYSIMIGLIILVGVGLILIGKDKKIDNKKWKF